MKHCSSIVLGLVCLGLGWHGPAEAGTDLSLLTFDSSNYVVHGGGTVQVSVFLSQVATGGTDPAVGPLNPLTLATFQISFNNPSGVAAVLSTNNITPNSAAFDFSLPTVSSTQATLEELSIHSPGLGSLPGLLGTFTFTGLNNGTTTISVAQITPLSSFTTTPGGPLSPSSATATITTIPEPSSILILLTGGPLLLLGGLVLPRSRRWASRESRQ